MNPALRLHLLAAVAALATVLSPVAAAQPIKLGELNSYKTFPAFLEPYKKGMDLAVEEINAAGGVLGRPLEDRLARRQRQPGRCGPRRRGARHAARTSRY